MKKIFFTLFLALCSINTWAYDVEVNGIYYDLNTVTNTATVTYKEKYSESYSGDVTIPKNFLSDGTTYTVTGIGEYAFYVSKSLTSVKIASTVTSIGESAFNTCSSLTSLTIPDSVTIIGNYAFGGCGITEITIPSSVMGIGKGLFSSCKALESIKVDGDNTIFDSRNNCNAIIETATNTLIAGCKTTTIRGTVTKIGTSAFYGHEITAITIPNSVVSIGDYAFCDCEKLTSISIPNSVTTIGSYAFNGCSSLASLTIGKSVSIGTNPFDGCNALTSLKVAEENVKYDSRNSCDAIIETASNTIISGCKTTVIPEGITTIAGYAFHGLTELTSITFPYTVRTIERWSFRETGLKTIIEYAATPPTADWLTWPMVGGNYINLYVPKGCVDTYKSDEDWGEFAHIMPIEFDEEKDDVNYTLNFATKTAIVTAKSETSTAKAARVGKKFAPYSGDVVISDTLMVNDEVYTVVGIGEGAFAFCTDVTSVTIPETVTSIENTAFSSCTSLASINIPNGVTSIGYYAFSNCTSLTSMTIPETVTSIGQSAFGGCTSLASVNLQKGLTDIGYNAFSGCTGLTSINIPETVTSIKGSAFSGCTGLTSVTLPNEFKYIESNVFAECTSLTTINVPDSLAYIGDYAFYGCEKLATLPIGKSLKEIDNYAFLMCSSLTSVTIPASVNRIGTAAFAGCSGLTSIKVDEENTVYDSRNNCNAIIETENNTLLAGCNSTVIPGTVTSIGMGAFMYCGGLTNINIPESVTTIGNSAFGACTGLTTVTIPKSVTIIGDIAFAYCTGLTTITIPKSVTTIGEMAFAYCTGLKTVYNCATEPQTLTATVFAEVPVSNVKLYVPEASVEAYKAAEYWKDFDIDVLDGIENVNANENANVGTRKHIENGKLLIVLPNGKKFTVSGKRVE